MKCIKKIPCPKGSMLCCSGCKAKGCGEKCSLRIRLWCAFDKYAGAIKWGFILLILATQILILCRLSDLEQEHNAIIDRLDQVENNITETVKENPAGETTPEGNLGGEFKSWMSFQTTLG